MLHNQFVLVIVFICPLVFMSPVRQDEEKSETCRGDYCSMFEGICQNGGTCVNLKGCEGECICPSQFSGVNCLVPNTPVTTNAPKPKKEKSDEDSRNRDFSSILSLFRILQHRPVINRPASKKENASKKDNRKESDKNAGFADNKRENYPSRSESKIERKQEQTKENDIKDFKKDKNTPKKTNTKKIQALQSESKSTVATQTDNRIHSTTLPTKTTGFSVEIKPTKKVSTHYGQDSHSRRINPAKTRNHAKKNTHSTSIHSLKSPENIHRKNGSTILSGKTGHFIQNVFQAPMALKSSTNSKNKMTQISSVGDKNSVHKSGSLVNIANAGHKVLSSSTLSNLYLSRAILSKSRIFVSTMPSRIVTGKDISTTFEISTTKPIEMSKTKINMRSAKNEIKDSFVNETTTMLTSLKPETSSQETTINPNKNQPVKTNTASLTSKSSTASSTSMASTDVTTIKPLTLVEGALKQVTTTESSALNNNKRSKTDKTITSD